MSIPLVGSQPTPPDNLDERLKRLLIILAIMGIALTSVFVIRILWPIAQWIFGVLAPFIIGLVLAYVLNPLVSLIQRKFKLSRGGGLALVALLLVLILLAMLGLVIYLIFQVDDAYQYITTNWQPTYERIATFLTPYIDEAFLNRTQEYLQQIPWNEVGVRVGEGTWSVAHGIASGVGAFIGIIILTVFVAITCLYYLIDFHKIPRIARILTPDEREPQLFSLFRKIDEAVGGFLRGQLLDCMAVGMLVTILMLAWGPRKWAVLIGAVAGAVNFIPYLGPVAGATPAVLWALFTPSLEGMTERLIKAAYIIIAFWVVQLVDNWVFQPKIVGKHAQLHPLAVLLALFIGVQFGLAGMIVAVPTACIVRVLIKELWWDRIADEDSRRQLKEQE